MNNIGKCPEENYKSGFVSIIGLPNAGKSTLLNALIGEKIAIVSPRPQTTRNRIMGVLTSKNSQMIFLDTPGIHTPKNKLGSFMESEIIRAGRDSDLILYVVDSYDGLDFLHKHKRILEKYKSSGVKMLLVLNKIDKLRDKSMILPLADELCRSADFLSVLMISAVRADALESLLLEIEKYLPYGPQLYLDDTFTDQTERSLVEEIVREKIFLLLDAEVPFGTAVQVEKMKFVQEKNLCEISCLICCEKPNHKSIILGRGGAMIKKIASLARRDVENLLQTQVFIKIFVKVDENWRDSSFKIRQMGYKSRNF